MVWLSCTLNTYEGGRVSSTADMPPKERPVRPLAGDATRPGTPPEMPPNRPDHSAQAAIMGHGLALRDGLHRTGVASRLHHVVCWKLSESERKS